MEGPGGEVINTFPYFVSEVLDLISSTILGFGDIKYKLVLVVSLWFIERLVLCLVGSPWFFMLSLAYVGFLLYLLLYA